MKRFAIAIAGVFLFVAACQPAPVAPTNTPSAPQPSLTAAPAEPTQTVQPTQALAETAYPYPAPGSDAQAMPPTAYPAPLPQVPAANVSAFPDVSQFTWVKVVDGLEKPLDLIGDGQGRLLVVQQYGKILVIENGQVRGEPFLNIGEKLATHGNEQGLLGIALHPQYAQNGFFFVNYSGVDGRTVIARFTADPAVAEADPSSEKILLEVAQPYENHNGGGLRFGPDGMLYIGMGDGGSGGDPHGNGQNMDTLLGKMLRIDVNQGEPYAIPADNPYADGGARAEIWASGLRNPFRFAFDRADGSLYIGDVGQNIWEEIDYQPAGSAGGENYGWNLREGANAFQGTVPEGLALVDPIYQYQHPVGCSVTGGEVYRGMDLPEFQGVYLFGDYCTGRIWGLLRNADDTWQNQELFQTNAMISSFGLDERGEVYLLDHKNMAVLRLSRK